MAEEGRSRLGRGLAALIGDVGGETPTVERVGRTPRRVPVEHVKPNPRNPRRTFTEAELTELTDSIRERGIIQPIVVRPEKGAPDRYEIIAGERRWRAAQRAGLHDVPVVVIEATDRESLEFAIVENVQRADLNAIEEAHGYDSLMAEFDYSQDDVARIVGKSRSHIANTVRLLKLSEPVQALVRGGKISAGHARVLIGQPNALDIAMDIIDRGLSVRQVEEEARAEGKRQSGEVSGESPQAGRGGGVVKRDKDPDTIALEKRVSDALGLAVTIEHRPAGNGVFHIKYRDLDQLDEVVRRLGGGG